MCLVFALALVSFAQSSRADDLETIPALPADIEQHLYVYNATVTEVYDADTITVQVDLGFHVSMEMRLRLYGIDTWEVRGAERPRGLVARDWLRERVLGKQVKFRSVRDGSRITGKFGRYLAVIYDMNPGSNEWTNINDELVRLGHGEYEDY